MSNKMHEVTVYELWCIHPNKRRIKVAERPENRLKEIEALKRKFMGRAENKEDTWEIKKMRVTQLVDSEAILRRKIDDDNEKFKKQREE